MSAGVADSAGSKRLQRTTLPLFGPQMAAECAILCGRDTKERWARAEDGLQLHWNAHRSK